jgi:hypothetical protein
MVDFVNIKFNYLDDYYTNLTTYELWNIIYMRGGSKMPIKEMVKIMLAKSDITLTELVNRLNQKYNKKDSLQNLSKKINKGTLRYEEAEEIAEVLGYKIEWIKRD